MMDPVGPSSRTDESGLTLC